MYETTLELESPLEVDTDFDPAPGRQRCRCPACSRSAAAGAWDALSSELELETPEVCRWVAATNADVARDGMTARYRELLGQPVGSEVIETHNGRLWKLQVISSKSGLTRFAKDVKGWVCPAGLPPVLPDELAAWDQYFANMAQAYAFQASDDAYGVEDAAKMADQMLVQRRARQGKLSASELTVWDAYYAAVGQHGAKFDASDASWARYNAGIADMMLDARRRRQRAPGSG